MGRGRRSPLMAARNALVASSISSLIFIAHARTSKINSLLNPYRPQSYVSARKIVSPSLPGDAVVFEPRYPASACHIVPGIEARLFQARLRRHNRGRCSLESRTLRHQRCSFESPIYFSLFYKVSREVIVSRITLPVAHRRPLKFVIKSGADSLSFQVFVYSISRIQRRRWRGRVSR
jgi:hypothetical protein